MAKRRGMNISPLTTFLKRLESYSVRSIEDFFKQWGRRYLGEMRKRYDAASRSPGNPWEDLAESTKKGRMVSRAEQRAGRVGGQRRGRGVRRRAKMPIAKRGFAILKDTGILFNALSVGKYGNLFRKITRGQQVGFSSDSHDSGSATMGKIAQYHQEGGNGLPKREILVKQSTQLDHWIKRALSNALLEEIIRAGGKRR